MAGNGVLWSPGKEPAGQGWDIQQPLMDHHLEEASESWMGQKSCRRSARHVQCGRLPRKEEVG